MTPMNDKQRDLALELAVIHARKIVCPTQVEWAQVGEVLGRFDAAAAAPKRKYTVDDIKAEDDEGFRRVWCGEYGWTDRGWERRVSHTYSPLMAEVIRAGLVATGNVPEVGE